MIIYSGIGSYGCKYIILMKTHLKKKHDRIISATDTSWSENWHQSFTARDLFWAVQ